MVFKTFGLVVLVSLMCVFVMGCTGGNDDADDTAAEVGSTVEETTEEVVSNFNEVKSAYVKTVKGTVKEWNDKIGALVEKKDALPAAAQAPIEESMKELLSSQDDVANKLSAVEDANEDSFEAKKSELDSALGGLSDAYKKVSSLF